jgi:hypothetical protein
MAAMTCNKFQTLLPDMLLDSASAPIASHVPIEVQEHLASCSSCQNDWRELQATMQLLDAWGAPEPSPYFATRMAARLRAERSSKASGWLEQIRAHFLFDSKVHLRPAMAAAAALLLIAGFGSYEGFVSLNRTQPTQHQTVSATVNDLELLDRNAQTLQQLAAFDDSDATVGQGSSGSASN